MKHSFWDMLIADINNKTKSAIANKQAVIQEKQHPFLKKCAPQHPINGVYFTPRETECIVKMLYGNTMKNTAKELGLSPRTVEFYIQKIKRKLKCRTKSALIRTITQAFIDELPKPNRKNNKPCKPIPTK